MRSTFLLEFARLFGSLCVTIFCAHVETFQNANNFLGERGEDREKRPMRLEQMACGFDLGKRVAVSVENDHRQGYLPRAGRLDRLPSPKSLMSVHASLQHVRLYSLNTDSLPTLKFYSTGTNSFVRSGSVPQFGN